MSQCAPFVALILSGTVDKSAAEDLVGISNYGVPGHVDMPSGFALPDGTVAVSANAVDIDIQRGAVAFQVTPRLTGLFRYSYLGRYIPPDGSLYDRSFDVRYLIAREDRDGWIPAVSVGLQDFGGTGIFGAEYIAASKHFGEDVTATLGIGWGRFGTHNGFDNPLGIINESFEHRPGFTGIEDTGRVAFDRFFRGDAAIFFGADWRPIEPLRLSFEYSSDAMTQERPMGLRYAMPFNIGAQYRFRRGGTLGVSLLSGSTLGVNYGFTLDPFDPPSHSGREPGPPAIGPGTAEPASAWQPVPGADRRAALGSAFAEQGLVLEGIRVEGDTAVIDMGNGRWGAAAQAHGRAAAILSARLPRRISIFRLRSHVAGMPVTEVTLTRADLEDLEHALDGSWQSYARAGISDAVVSSGTGQWDPAAGLWIYPYVSPFFFDPDNPLRADAGIAVGGDWSPARGFHLTGEVRAKVVGNLDEADRPSNSTLPHVRSDAWLYARESSFFLPHLTADYYWRPGEALYAHASAGLLERMFGGVSGEVLWAPPGQRVAVGMDLSYVRQRDYDGGFGFQDYDTVTGFVSTYYDFGDGFRGQMDVGRYLAKDWGSTFAVTRHFNNGFEFGAFFTLTDVSFDDFGEGSFDKGIGLSVPLSWMTGKPSRNRMNFQFRPILRDGGAQLALRDRLYYMTRPERQEELAARWGRFWR
ncbi:YjbH domain-containing protein [Amaricoccus sp. W119]|uniref:YjbH domain-containing protein n=1 Tax=Amaricoccus sp. W119 TaxID=3391833 RepID=UPI0039A6C963